MTSILSKYRLAAREGQAGSQVVSAPSAPRGLITETRGLVGRVIATASLLRGADKKYGNLVLCIDRLGTIRLEGGNIVLASPALVQAAGGEGQGEDCCVEDG